MFSVCAAKRTSAAGLLWVSQSGAYLRKTGRWRKISEEDSRRDEQERAKSHEVWAWKARNLSAWAPRGMG